MADDTYWSGSVFESNLTNGDFQSEICDRDTQAGAIIEE